MVEYARRRIMSGLVAVDVDGSGLIVGYRL
jgi:hypothetical protein